MQCELVVDIAKDLQTQIDLGLKIEKFKSRTFSTIYPFNVRMIQNKALLTQATNHLRTMISGSGEDLPMVIVRQRRTNRERTDYMERLDIEK